MKEKFINTEMGKLGINYEYGEWTQDVKYPYFVGIVEEGELSSENGYQESTLTLDGFTRGKFIELVNAKDLIRDKFNGLRGSTEKGSIAFSYDGSFPVPTNEAELKRIQLRFIIKEWRVI